jgi:hypothetical protein
LIWGTTNRDAVEGELSLIKLVLQVSKYFRRSLDVEKLEMACWPVEW